MGFGAIAFSAICLMATTPSPATPASDDWLADSAASRARKLIPKVSQ